ncbi:MAG: hypothetical protein ACYC2U_00205 [Candidatus Amoebophilus sp.]
MKRNYSFSHRLIACVLFISFFLQSCGGFQTQVIPQEFITSGGYLVSFYQDDGELKADLRADETQPEPNYKGVPVVVEQSICLADLIKLDSLTQQQRIQLRRKKGKITQVIVYNGGVAGGMKRDSSNQNFGNQTREKGKEKKEESMQREENSIGNQLYLALEQDDNHRFQGILRDAEARKLEVAGYALYKSVKKGELNSISEKLQSILESEEFLKCVAMSLLETIKEQDGESLQSLCEKYKGSTEHFSLDDRILSLLLEELTINGSSKEYKEYFKFLANQIEIPSPSLEFMQEGLIELNKNVSSFFKRIGIYQNAVPIPTKKLNHTKKFTCEFSQSADREEGTYSNSEDEDAPHFDGVYNLTKSRDKYINNYALLDTNLSREDLQKDAKAIRNKKDKSDLVAPGAAETDHPGFNVPDLTILCVALRQHDGRIKKFVFTNLEEGCVPDHIIKEAHDRNYHVIMAQRSHAEGEFLQFLQERPNHYTHIVSMGCDKEHCEPCTEMFEKWLGPGVLKKISRSGTDSTYFDWGMGIPPALEEFLKLHDCMPDNLSENTRKYNHAHRRLQRTEWKNRSWRRSPKQEKEEPEEESKKRKGFPTSVQEKVTQDSGVNPEEETATDKAVESSPKRRKSED